MELAAALQPDSAATAASLKERADARFKARDIEGAADAYTALVQMLQQQQAVASAAVGQDEQHQQQQQQEQEVTAQLLAALSNRAACWLSLEQYSRCIEDCHAALTLALAEPHATRGAGAMAAAATAAAANSTAAAGGTDAAAGGQAAAAEQYVLHLLQQRSPQQLLSLPCVGPARVRSTARLLSRLAMAHSCLKRVQHAVQLYAYAQQWWLAVGDEQRAAEMAADQQRLQQLLPTTQAA